MITRFRILAALALAFCLSSAIAAPKAREVEAQMRQKNWPQAEQMLREVLREKPQSAKAWYLMAQTQEHQRNLGDAMASLKLARQYDPTLAFASPGAADRMQGRLERALRPAAPPPSLAIERAPASAPTVIAPAPRLDPVSPSSISAPAAHNSESGGGFLFALVAIAALGGACYFIYRRFARRQESQQRDTDRRALLARALDAQTRAAELLKTARHEAPGTLFLAQASSIESAADSALGRLKSSSSSSFSLSDEESKLRELESRIESAESQADRKAWDEPAPAPKPSDAFGSSSFSRGVETRSSPYNGGFETRSTPSHGGYHTPAPVVVQNDSGSLLATMVMADLLTRDNGSSSRERDLERQLERERGRNERDSAPAYEAPEPSYEAPAYEAPELDFGSSSSSSSSDSDSGWDNPSVDTGSGKDEF